MQFDLFDQSHATALHNDVILALEKDDVALAQTAWQSLQRLYPEDACLNAFQQLIDASTPCAQVPLANHDALRAARLQLTETLAAAAQSCLGQQANAWLRQRWQCLARCAEGLAYRANRPEDHAAWVWLQAQEWQASADAVARIPSWRRIPAPLSWMLQARLQTQGLLANWGLLAELAWMAPPQLQSVIRQADDPILLALVAKFEQNFEGLGDHRDLAWFPAWVLIERPALASALTQAQVCQHSPPEQALRTLLVLLGLERQGRQREVIAQRKLLRGLNGELYRAYMATR